MSQDKIVVVGARENNLKNITVEIPRDKLVVITGLSGSGKSSLAFDTIYAEGQRRYVESLSAYARQFLGQMDKPDVDHIEGLSPAISIDQKSASKNPRSTVGTVTEIYDYLRLIYARAGLPYCPNGHGPIQRQSTDQIVDAAKELPEGTKLQILSPVVRGRKGEYKSVLVEISKAGYVRVRVDGEMYEVTDDIPMDRYKQHTIEVVVDRLVMKEGIERRLTDSIEAALKMGKGMVTLSYELPPGVKVAHLKGAIDPAQVVPDDDDAPALSSFDAVAFTVGANGDDEDSEDGRMVAEPRAKYVAGTSDDSGDDRHPLTPSSSNAQDIVARGGGTSESDPDSSSEASKSTARRPSPRGEGVGGEGAEATPDESKIQNPKSKIDSDNPQWIDQLFSESYSCAVCGFSMPELEPRMFSFNSPYGACPDCTGLGTKTEFDPLLVCPDLNKPLREGAIAPFVYKSGDVKDWWPELLDAVGREVGFDASKPVCELSESAMDAVWNGLTQNVTVFMRYGKHERKIVTKWEGVLTALKKRYQQTESEWVKKDLEQYMSTKPCPVCGGKRLKPECLSVLIAKKSIAEVTDMPVDECLEWCKTLPRKLNKRQMAIAERAVKEIGERLRFLADVGLTYLTLNRNARTLAGGEAQRIRLATQIGSGLMGCLYILDEPSIGLHQRDNRKLIETLVRLRNLGNTVLVVEHDEETMLSADWLIELGPGAGEHGGQIIAQGPVSEFLSSGCGTARFLTGDDEIEIPPARRQPRSPMPV